MGDRIPLLLDTDIGSDIDDAVALAYLLRQPRCELLGITTVSGDVGKRAACAEVICRAAGRTDVPIHCGASRVLLTGPGQPEVPQYEAVRRQVHQAEWPDNTALDFLRRTIRQRPGQITLLTIGPYTNAAILFAADPEIPGLLKQMVSMGGCYWGRADGPEWNARVDPIATAMVYGTPLPRHVNIGLDVTMKCQMAAEEVRRRFVKPPLNIVADMAEVWFATAERLTFHDPLAAATIFRPEVCAYARGQITVATGGGAAAAGHTQFEERADGRHLVASDVNVELFFEEYFSPFDAAGT